MLNWIKSYRDLLHLHFIVVILGFTGILGKLITLSSSAMVWYRMLIALLGLAAFVWIRKQKLKATGKEVANMVFIGILIAIHWVLFFESIKVSNVSVALACLASTSLFTALLEPLFFKRKIIGYEVLLGLCVILGLYLIFKFETEYTLGIVYSVVSAFFLALFTVINGKLVKKTEAVEISMWEMFGGALGLTVYMLVQGNLNVANLTLGEWDLLWLLILGLVCTSYAFVVSVDVMKNLSPFSVGITVNLEPIYSILLALLIFKESEYMSTGFYLGGLIILATIVGDTILKNKEKAMALLFGGKSGKETQSGEKALSEAGSDKGNS